MAHNEEWRPLPGFESAYSCSSHGYIRRDVGGKGARIGHYLTPLGRKDGYVKVNLSWEGVKHQVSIHRAICEAFHGPPPSEMHTVNHKNGIKADNRAENLEWATQSENNQHAYDTGLRTPRNGASIHTATLTESDVRAIRQRIAEGHTCAAVAKVFRISRPQASRIAARKTWAWVE